jgi:hypothetical protein
LIDLIHDIFKIADRYGLKAANIDATDVTLMAGIEIFPAIYIQVYRNLKKDKLNMALIFGKNRVYGVDGEGGAFHEHPAEDPTFHVPIKERLEIEEFVVRSLNILKNRRLL